MAADVAEGGVAHHLGELLIEGAHRGEGGGGDHLQRLGGEVFAVAITVVTVSVAVTMTVGVAVARCGRGGDRRADRVEGGRIE